MGAIKTLTLKLHYAKKQRVNKPVPWYALEFSAISCRYSPAHVHDNAPTQVRSFQDG